MDAANLTKVPVGETLSEERVWRELVEPKLVRVPGNVRSILHYCVTNLINNVKDHAQARALYFDVRLLEGEVECWLVDDGVGILRKLQSELGLEDAPRVALELARGQLTTDPSLHIGKGLFLSARMCDRFLLESGGVVCGHLEDGPWFVEQDRIAPYPCGTAVLMAVRLSTDRLRRAS